MTSQLIEISQNNSFRYTPYDIKWIFEKVGHQGDDVAFFNVKYGCLSATKTGHRMSSS